LGADLHVVKMKNWQRGDWFDSTGLRWSDPSPNLRSLNAAALYHGLALLEASPNYSVGRGTDAPFEQLGADWIHGAELAEFLNRWVLPGVRVYATQFQPSSGPFAGKAIEGVRFVIVNREQLTPCAWDWTWRTRCSACIRAKSISRLVVFYSEAGRWWTH